MNDRIQLLEGKSPFEAGSISAKEAGAAIRLACSRATRLRITQSEWRVLGTLFGLTLSRAKPLERTVVARIAEHAGLDRHDHTLRSTKKALKALAAHGIISYDAASKPDEMTIVGVSFANGVSL